MLLLLTACNGGQDQDSDSLPSVLDAAEQGDLQQMDNCLVGKQLVNMRDACLWTPLMKASLNGHLEAVIRLVEKDADIDLVDKGGYSAMMLAASNNFARVVDYLIQHGAMVDRVELTHGYTALIWAAKRGHADTVKVLLAHGADRNATDDENKTALQHAREWQHDDVVQLLNAPV